MWVILTKRPKTVNSDFAEPLGSNVGCDSFDTQVGWEDYLSSLRSSVTVANLPSSAVSKAGSKCRVL